MHNPTITGLIVALGYTAGPRNRWKPRRAPVPLHPNGLNPYRKKSYLFTRDERRFYDALCIVAEGRWRVFAKVRIEDIIDVPDGAPNEARYRGHIKSRHVDFVLCSLDSVSPALAIELDGDSHNDQDQQQIDANKDIVFQSADLPLLRQPSRDWYSPGILSSQIEDAIAGRNMNRQLTADEVVRTLRDTSPLSRTSARSNGAPTTRAARTWSAHRNTTAFGKQRRKLGVTTDTGTRIRRWAGLLLVRLGAFLVMMALVIFAAGLLMTGVRSTLVATFGLSAATPPARVATPGKVSGAAPTVTARTKVSSDVGRALPEITATVDTVNLNLRAGPGKQYQQYEAYPQGTRAKVLGKDPTETWLKVRMSSGKEGWMSARYLLVNWPIGDLPVLQTP